MAEGDKVVILDSLCDALSKADCSEFWGAQADGEINAPKPPEAVAGQKDPAKVVIDGVSENQTQYALLQIGPVGDLLGYMPGWGHSRADGEDIEARPRHRTAELLALFPEEPLMLRLAHGELTLAGDKDTRGPETAFLPAETLMM